MQATVKRVLSEKRKSVTEVPKEITETLTKFSDDPREIYQRREKIAEAIEEMIKKP